MIDVTGRDYVIARHVYTVGIQLPYDCVLFLPQSRWANLKKELLSTVIPMFLSNHPNSVPVLQAAWHCASQSQNVRGLVLHAMAEWYMRGEPHDQARLSRILDVAQDLKVYSRAHSATVNSSAASFSAVICRRA